ncbi:MAG: Orotidine 5'-phosphate decarboxylase [Candidatus Moranbacteria bacterium GW2011_GWC2_37_73]|nr:MAG: Orotidine 5'-phosphate decarboxylase [Parcubacteria group bacterium GW2011_GWC1_36_108]KKQ29993.1 MAG: Orotidine 5'-phosphate decarboxylase [Candidatus Moranbacteria bacterium GW2011_GWE1_37_24]KKQ39081.1 MAG: Orotidine 5'-phosphate decarboxylase [Candidatus Moranbacteria bacterium GW2011_GWC2_37_73]
MRDLILNGVGREDSRVIFPFDVHSLEEVEKFAQLLALKTACFKIGKQLSTAVGAPQAVKFVHNLGGEVFLDLKFNDIPETVAKAGIEAAHLGVRMFNVHALGGSVMMSETMERLDKEFSSSSRPKVIAVTVLTSYTYETLAEVGLVPPLMITDWDDEEVKCSQKIEIERLAVKLAVLAQKSGLDGVVASPQETALIREACGKDFLIITPGVRPAFAAANDQKRIMTPADAVRVGADYLVIGRPISAASEEIGGPVGAIDLINEEISQAMSERS